VPAEVQLRYDPAGQCFQAASGEIPEIAALRAVGVRLLAGSERGATHLPPAVRDVKVWATRSRLTAATRRCRPPESSGAGCCHSLRPGDLGGQVVLPLSGAGFEVQIAFPEKDA